MRGTNVERKKKVEDCCLKVVHAVCDHILWKVVS